MNYLPKARTENMVVQDLPQEMLIYDLISNQIFRLNETSAMIWNNCDGKTAINEIAAKQGIPEEIVLLTLEKLSRKRLLADKFESKILTEKLSRRRVISGAASVAIVLPIITTFIAPTAIAAQSGACVQDGQFLTISASDEATCLNEIFPAADAGCCNKSSLAGFNIPNPGECSARCGPPPRIQPG